MNAELLIVKAEKLFKNVGVTFTEFQSGIV